MSCATTLHKMAILTTDGGDRNTGRANSVIGVLHGTGARWRDSAGCIAAGQTSESANCATTRQSPDTLRGYPAAGISSTASPSGDRGSGAADDRIPNSFINSSPRELSFRRRRRYEWPSHRRRYGWGGIVARIGTTNLTASPSSVTPHAA